MASQAQIDNLVADAAAERARAAKRKRDAAPTLPVQPPPVFQTAPRAPDVKRILGLSVPVSVVLASRPMPIASLLEMHVGTIIEFDVPFDSELALEVAQRPIGEGQAVKIGENFGVRLNHIGSIRARINAMGGQ